MRILIAEDSDMVAMLLQSILDNEPDMEVIGRAYDGREAVQLVDKLHPDLVTMDIRMPEMDGFEATRLIMSTRPTPIVVISSSVDDEELRITFRAIEEGALAVLEKPHGLTHPDFQQVREQIVDTVRAMAEVKLVRRRHLEPARGVDIYERGILQRPEAYEVVAIALSTGGPAVLQQLLASLSIGYPIPILVTQHIARGFIGGLVAWLHSCTLLNVKCAEQGEALIGGTVYFAPENYHLLVERNVENLVARLNSGPPINDFKPSATPMFHSIAEVSGAKGIGVLLTGMGVDGADGLLSLRRNGGHTIVQDEESSVVYGMPGAALALDAVEQIVPLNKLPAYLTNLTSQ